MEAASRVTAIRIKLGFKSQEAFAAAANVSKSTIMRIERGDPMRKNSYVSVATALGVDTEDIHPAWAGHWRKPLQTILDRVESKSNLSRCEDALDRIPRHFAIIQRYWLAPEMLIHRAAATYEAMVEDVRRIAKFEERLSLAQRRDAGLLAAELMGCFWSFRGPQSMESMAWLHRFAGTCAVGIEFDDTAGASTIQGIRNYNRMGMAAWSRPDVPLREDGAYLITNNFEQSARCFEFAGLADPETYGASASDIGVQLLHSSQIFSQTGKRFSANALAIIEQAESLEFRGDLLLSAHIARAKGAHAEMMGDQTGAIEWFEVARDCYERAYKTTMHYTYASCGMRIRFLGKPLKKTLEHDLNVLASSAVRYTDIVNLETVRNRYTEDFRKRQGLN
jgi:DNA-binding XRE family transcriptional regulator